MPFVATAQVGADCVTTDGKAGKIAVGSGAMGGGQTYCQPNTQAGSNNPVVAAVGIGLDKVGGYLLEYTGISNFLMGATSFILIFSGWLLDSVLSFTVTGMSDQIGTGTTIGTSITEAWGIIRDVANMVFIFVLLYTAFRTMFMSEYSNVGRSILNIVLIAILINFSLFFAKVVIDASNIVADGFYRAISQGNSMTLKNSNIGVAEYKGISGGVMKMLGMQTIYGTGVTKDGSLFSTAGASRILLFGTVSGIFMIVASVVFFMASIMFIARFIILIFLMILAPFAFIAFIIPGFSGRFWDWWASLFNQAFFAPVFFALMWVAFKVGSAIVTKPLNSEYGTDWSYIITDPKKAFGAVINYVLVLGLFITALTISKQMASKGSTAAAFGAITGTVGGVVGGATIGAAGWAGRQTLGRAGARISQSGTLRDLSAKGGVTGYFAKKTLQAGSKVGESTFDARGIKSFQSAAGGALKDLGEARKSAKGGYLQSLKGEEEKEFQKKFLGTTPQEAFKQQELEKIAADATKNAKSLEEDMKEKEKRMIELRAQRDSRPFNESARYNREIGELEKEILTIKNRYDTEMGVATEADNKAKTLKDVASERSVNYEKNQMGSWLNKLAGRNKEVVLALRANAKENKETKKLLEKLAKMQEEDKKKDEETPKPQPGTNA